MNTDIVTTAATGPKTAEGKRIAARNATTHGLFARDVVLPHLGEDPQGYTSLLNELTAQIRPKNLLDQHYTEKIAAASWRLRRLHRWQAQLFEDPELTEDAALARLDRVMRHETALHRQIDTAVRMLGRDVPDMFKSRIREEQLAFAQVTERDCQKDEEWDWVIANNTREQLQKLSARPQPLDEDPSRLDAAPAAPAICQNEPAPDRSPSPVPGEVARLAAPEGVPSPCSEGEPEGVPLRDNGDENCQNEPAPSLTPPELGAGGPTPPPGRGRPGGGGAGGPLDPVGLRLVLSKSAQE
ncbi:MAG: hypothetical protein JO250_06155 [Armatimonadetes bacterium]|nr:hypothetical protein [Armatimonadota bacterium]